MAKSKPTKSKTSQSSAAKAYLFAYNFIQTIGWSYLLYLLLAHYTSSSNEPLYETVKIPLIIFQNAAILEVVHAAVRLVPSNPMITAQQVASRVMLVCGVLIATEAPKYAFGLPLALFAWSITEVIRYANYALNLVNMVPHLLVWMRYSFFVLLYPIGVTGELLCLYAAQNEVAKTELWTIRMPNLFNFAFEYRYFLIFVMLLYIPLFPQMYLHMFTQRKKVLGKPEESKKSK